MILGFHRAGQSERFFYTNKVSDNVYFLGFLSSFNPDKSVNFFANFQIGYFYDTCKRSSLFNGEIIADILAFCSDIESFPLVHKASANSQDERGEQLNFMYFACTDTRNDSKVCRSLIGQKHRNVFWHQSEARTAATVWNLSGKTLSLGALRPRSLLFFRPFFSRPFRLSLAPTICPCVSEDAEFHANSNPLKDISNPPCSDIKLLFHAFPKVEKLWTEEK